VTLFLTGLEVARPGFSDCGLASLGLRPSMLTPVEVRLTPAGRFARQHPVDLYCIVENEIDPSAWPIYSLATFWPVYAAITLCSGR